jgi:hypothetical protein
MQLNSSDLLTLVVLLVNDAQRVAAFCICSNMLDSVDATTSSPLNTGIGVRSS